MTIAIISIIMISCLVKEESQWFFLYFKLCFEIHCHYPGTFFKVVSVLSYRHRNEQYRGELLESYDLVAIRVLEAVDRLGSYLLLENQDLSWG